MDRQYPGTTRAGKRRCRPAVESAMGAAFAFIFIYKLNGLGFGFAAWHSGMDRLPLYGLENSQRRVASCSALGLDSGIFRMAIPAIQPDHALSTAHLSIVGDDG